MSELSLRDSNTTGRIDRQVLASVVIVALAAIVWYTAKVLLLGFAGILLAVFLDFLAAKLADISPLTRGWAFVVVAVGVSLLLGLAAWVAAPRIADQVSELIHAIPQGMDELRRYLNGREWGRTILSYLPNILASANLTERVTSIAKGAGDAVAGLAVIAVLGLYWGATPTPYKRGLLSLVPQQHRDHAAHIVEEVAYTLRWWVLGQLIPMGVLGLVTIIGLWILHVPLAFTLGLFTGFMIFIPYVGSVIALVVTVLVTAIHSSSQVLWVVLLFMIVHSVEGYLLTPLIQKRAVHVPPGVTIMSQLIMGALLGFLGLALATPLAATVLVLVQMLYLHQRPAHH